MAKRADRPTFLGALSHLGTIIAISAVMGVLIAGLAIPVVAGIGFGARAADRSLTSLPQKLRTEPLPQRSLVLDSHGHVLATFFDQNRISVPLRSISPIMRKAIVAIEDYRFYQHGALDVKGTLRAFVTNQTSGGATQGGSSITQQLAKMTAVEQARTAAQRRAATADTYARKFLELRHAIAFEHDHSKDWILNRYLNIAYFGDGAYGVQAAAKHYFHVDAKDLNIRQAALLAGLVKNPVGYSPTQFPDRALARRNIVLARMAQLHVIPTSLADRLEQKSLGLHVTSTSNGCVSSKAPFFCDYVRRYLLADSSLGKTVEDRRRVVNAGGVTIKTTIDLRFQRAADAAVRSHVYPTDQAIGAIAMIQPGTGDVKAIAQSRPMGRNAKRGQTYLNYIVPSQYGDSAGFQAGSTFKLFVLAAALEEGIPTSTTFNSPNTLSIPQNEYPDCHGPYPVYSPWVIHNSTGAGTFNMYKGAQLSVNTYFAQLEKKTGLCKPYELAKKMGVELTNPSHERVPSFTLGIASVSPLEMAQAYATVADRGVHCDARPVTQILNSAGKVFKNYPQRCHRVMSKYTADTINDILKGLMAPGGFGQYLTLDKPSAGKTGTIDSNMAVWFDGYTPSLAAASMVAGANRQGHWITLNGQVVGGQYVASAHGSTTAGPMWADAMRRVQNLLPYKNFVPPSQDNNPHQTQPAQGQVTVPSVTGMSESTAGQLLAGAGLRWVHAGSVGSSLPSGQVASTNPSPGQNVPSGTTVYVYTSDGSGG